MPTPGEGKTVAKSGPPGSAQVACVLVELLAAIGVVAKTTALDRESDYAAFVDAGIARLAETGSASPFASRGLGARE